MDAGFLNRRSRRKRRGFSTAKQLKHAKGNNKGTKTDFEHEITEFTERARELKIKNAKLKMAAGGGEKFTTKKRSNKEVSEGERKK